MTEPKITADNEFQYYAHNNGSNKNDFNENPNSLITTIGISSSYSLEDTANNLHMKSK